MPETATTTALLEEAVAAAVDTLEKTASVVVSLETELQQAHLKTAAAERKNAELQAELDSAKAELRKSANHTQPRIKCASAADVERTISNLVSKQVIESDFAETFKSAGYTQSLPTAALDLIQRLSNLVADPAPSLGYGATRTKAANDPKAAKPRSVRTDRPTPGSEFNELATTGIF